MSKYRCAVDRNEVGCAVDGMQHRWYVIYTDSSCNSLVEACENCTWARISELKDFEHKIKYHQILWKE